MPSAVYPLGSNDICEKENFPDLENVENDRLSIKSKMTVGDNGSNEVSSRSLKTRWHAKTATDSVAGPSTCRSENKQNRPVGKRTLSSDAEPANLAGRLKKKSLPVGGGQLFIDGMFAKAQKKLTEVSEPSTEHVIKVEIESDAIPDSETEVDHAVEKKIKLDVASEVKEEAVALQLNHKPRVLPTKCQICRQLLDNEELKLYQGHPNGAVEELVALTDPRLSLFTGEESMINESDERPQNKLTHFRYELEFYL